MIYLSHLDFHVLVGLVLQSGQGNIEWLTSTFPNRRFSWANNHALYFYLNNTFNFTLKIIIILKKESDGHASDGKYVAYSTKHPIMRC